MPEFFAGFPNETFHFLKGFHADNTQAGSWRLPTGSPARCAAQTQHPSSMAHRTLLSR